MVVALIGRGEYAEAHRAWYATAGAAVIGVDPAAGGECPEAELYDLCADVEDRAPILAALLRRRRAALLLTARPSLTAAEAGHIARAASRRRCPVALTGGWRFVPAFARMREWVAGGILGTVRTARVQVATTGPVEHLMPAAMDLGLWLAGDGELSAGTADSGSVCFHAAAATVDIAIRRACGEDAPAWSVSIEAELGQAAAQAVFQPGLPGRMTREQCLSVTLGGRCRRFNVPVADPAAGELGAILARQAHGQPWLAVCTVERAARLLALWQRDVGKVAGEQVESG